MKNLEAIEGTRKVQFVNRILDFHIRTNFYLIDYFHQALDDETFKSVAAYVLTWGGHKFMAASLGNSALCAAIKGCIDSTENDFKMLLLVLLLSDLRDVDALKLIRDFLSKTGSRAAIEIVFIHLRHRMIEHELQTLPTELIAVFRAAFEKRQALYGKRQDKTKMNATFDKLLRETKREHQVVRQSGITD